MSASTIEANAVKRAEFRITTWLLAGACCQSLLILLLPGRLCLAILPAIAVLAARVLATGLRVQGLLRNPCGDKVLYGRATAQIPLGDGTFSKTPATKGIVVFILGARSNHPLGLFAPGLSEIGDLFQSMWSDLAANREKWGFLGKTSTLIATDSATTNAIVTISYWESMEHLHAFARGASHRAGWDFWNAGKFKHLGIMHETYCVPAGNWENIYHNFTPFGMGQTEHIVNEMGDGGEQGRLVSSLTEVKGSNWKSMFSRMGRVDKE